VEESGRQGVKQTIEVIDRQIQRLVRLLDVPQAVSRIKKELIQLRRNRKQLSVLVANSVESVRPLIDACRLEISVLLPSEAVWLDVDAIRLEKVLANLLDNAVKNAQPGGQIRLAAQRQDQQVVIRVNDTGVGVHAAVSLS
jgi:K+-sensing histidine kinase KdpD